jgi:hypothetical protein
MALRTCCMHDQDRRVQDATKRNDMEAVGTGRGRRNTWETRSHLRSQRWIRQWIYSTGDKHAVENEVYPGGRPCRSGVSPSPVTNSQRRHWITRSSALGACALWFPKSSMHLSDELGIAVSLFISLWLPGCAKASRGIKAIRRHHWEDLRRRYLLECSHFNCSKI